METSGHVSDLVADLVRRENRALRRSFVYTGIAVLVSGLWLAYTIYRTRQLSDQARTLEEQIVKKQTELQTKDGELAAKQEKLESVAAILELSPDQLIELYNYGWKTNYLADTTLNREKIQASTDANQARQQIASSTDNTNRRNVVIEYFLKDVDREKVTHALRELGFKLDIKDPVNTHPTNAIWFGRQVNPEDAKLVAFTLMRAGVQLKEIRYFRRGSPRANSSLIQVGSNPSLLKRPSLSVKDISSMNFAAD